MSSGSSARFQRVFVGSNLKMYKTNRQTLDFLHRLQELTRDIPRTELSLFFLPSYTALADACREADHNLCWIGAQNMHWEEQGRFTGEISPLMLAEIGVDLVMIGHAERRQVFGETDEMVNRRVLSSLAHKFQTLICVGDTQHELQYGVSADVLRQQLKIALFGVSAKQLEKVWLAYEPVWAIGEGGQPAEPGLANEMHAVLRQVLADLYPGKEQAVPILYGGSVDLENIEGLMEQPEMDGLFVGRAAWEADRFNQIVRKTLAARRSAQG